MLDIHAARDRAIRRAIETGHMPNIDLIHTIQKTEGYRPCFGRCDGACHEVVCRWHPDCMALASFRPKPAPVAGACKPRRFGGTPDPGTGTYRDGEPSDGGSNNAGTGASEAHRLPTAANSPAPHTKPEQLAKV